MSGTSLSRIITWDEPWVCRKNRDTFQWLCFSGCLSQNSHQRKEVRPRHMHICIYNIIYSLFTYIYTLTCIEVLVPSSHWKRTQEQPRHSYSWANLLAAKWQQWAACFRKKKNGQSRAKARGSPNVRIFLHALSQGGLLLILQLEHLSHNQPTVLKW